MSEHLYFKSISGRRKSRLQDHTVTPVAYRLHCLHCLPFTAWVPRQASLPPTASRSGVWGMGDIQLLCHTNCRSMFCNMGTAHWLWTSDLSNW